jgi:hypothetical protein
MMRFWAGHFFRWSTEIAEVGALLDPDKRQIIDDPNKNKALAPFYHNVKALRDECASLPLNKSVDRAFSWLDGSIVCGLHDKIQGDVERVKEEIEESLSEVIFLVVDPSRAAYLDTDRAGGDTEYLRTVRAIARTFKAAERDLVSAGNCYALELWTACIFHLMRGAEIALSTLIAHMTVGKTNKPFSECNWQDLLGAVQTEHNHWDNAPSGTPRLGAMS